MQTTDTDTAVAEIFALSSGPETVPTAQDGYAAVRFNAMRHGILSRYTVLSHENVEEYESLVNALMQEHLPCGATEQHLVEELASVIWRKRRVLQAEGAIINQGLQVSASSARTVIPAAAPFELGMSGSGTRLPDVMDMTPDDVTEQRDEAATDIAALRASAKALRGGGRRAYARAVKELPGQIYDWWRERVQDGTYPADEAGLRAFLDECEPVVYQQEKHARHHESIKAQAQGEGLQAWKLLPLNRYETQLDRKFERTLGMLLKLKELRASR